MFTDILGYTALMQQDEDKALVFRNRHREVFNTVTEKYEGKILQYYGDGTLSIFDSAINAVKCGIEIQLEYLKEPVIPVRIGIHTGDIIYNDEDVIGDGVNIASHIESLGVPGSILISDKVYDEIKNQVTIQTQSLQTYKLKNVDRPIELFAIANPGLIIPDAEDINDKIKDVKTDPDKTTEKKKPKWRKKKMNWILYPLFSFLILIVCLLIYKNIIRPDLNTHNLDKSIAVLPFRNESPDQENEYLCNGMMDELLSNLQKIADLNVRSRTSVEQYRNTQKDLRQIAGELKVTYVVEGSIQKVGDKIKIIAQLIEAKNDDHLWANTYAGKYTDEIFNFQSEVAMKIASSLNAVITPKEEESIEKTPTKSIAAYDFYLKGNEMRNKYWELHYDRHLNLAHDLFDRALEIDPDFQYAISAKSGVYLVKGLYDSSLIYADKAISLEPESPQGYSVKGDCYMNLGKYDLAIENYMKAISLLTGDEWDWPHYAIIRTYLWGMKDPVKGLKFANESLEKFDREPRAYLSIAECYIYVGDYENAEKSYRKRLLLIPGCKGISEVSWVLNVQSKYEEAFDFLDSVCGTRACLDDCSINKFRISMAQKEFEQAQGYYKRFIEVGGEPEITDRIWLAYMYKNLNQEQEALTTLNNARMVLQNLADKLPITPPTIIDLASVHALLDEKDKALKYLSDAADLGFIEGWHDYLPECPLFEGLWDDPKFKSIVKQAREEKATYRPLK